MPATIDRSGQAVAHELAEGVRERGGSSGVSTGRHVSIRRTAENGRKLAGPVPVRRQHAHSAGRLVALLAALERGRHGGFKPNQLQGRYESETVIGQLVAEISRLGRMRDGSGDAPSASSGPIVPSRGVFGKWGSKWALIGQGRRPLSRALRLHRRARDLQAAARYLCCGGITVDLPREGEDNQKSESQGLRRDRSHQGSKRPLAGHGS
jgi:hypothetical protein